MSQQIHKINKYINKNIYIYIHKYEHVIHTCILMPGGGLPRRAVGPRRRRAGEPGRHAGQVRSNHDNHDNDYIYIYI